MSKPGSRKTCTFDRPGTYRIRVLGFLDENFSDRLAGLRISQSGLKDHGGAVTELFGQVRDQAELAGLLNNLYELHLTVWSVEYINGD